MEKIEMFHELCYKVEELVNEYNRSLNVPSIYIDLSVWNDYVTVKFPYKEYLAFTKSCVHTSPDLNECLSWHGVERIYAVSRVRGGYKIEREK